MVRLAAVASPVTGILINSHLHGVLRRDASGELIDKQRRHLRHRTLLVDHLEQVRAYLFESVFEVFCVEE